MWLPKPIYEALPAIYVVIGAIFLLGAGYLSFSHPASVAYAALGIACILTGIFVRQLRRKARAGKTEPPRSNERPEAG